MYQSRPPAAIVAEKLIRQYPAAVPCYRERVPYIVVEGPHTRLIDLVVSPEQFLSKRVLRLNHLYYIKRLLIPALDRLMAIFDVNLLAWYQVMPKGTGAYLVYPRDHKALLWARTELSILPLDQFYSSRRCLLCKADCSSIPKGQVQLCPKCAIDPATVYLLIRKRSEALLAREGKWRTVCRSCADLIDLEEIPCSNSACEVLHSRTYLKESQSIYQRAIEGLEMKRNQS